MNDNFKTLKEVDEFLTGLGFKKYTKDWFNQEACAFYQKKVVDDDGGVKYFIDAHVYDYTMFERVPADFSIEYSCQLYKNGNHDAFDVTFISWKPQDVVVFIENLLNHNIIEYYERGE